MPSDVKEEKRRIRERVWRALEERNLARFPRPVFGRIPNFAGAEDAAARLASLPGFVEARAVKVNPDAPQRMVRFHTLSRGKLLLTPTPRLRRGFIQLDPAAIPKGLWLNACSIGGAAKHGIPVGINRLPHIDLIVAGSVAVSPKGARLGKGEGYSELEYAILREVKAVEEHVQVLTTVHEIQVVDEIPVEAHDVAVDIIATPTRLIRTGASGLKPRGIDWSRVTEDMLKLMPILAELRAKAY